MQPDYNYILIVCIMDRRNAIRAMILCATAPAIVKLESIMPVKSIVVPDDFMAVSGDASDIRTTQGIIPYILGNPKKYEELSWGRPMTETEFNEFIEQCLRPPIGIPLQYKWKGDKLCLE